MTPTAVAELTMIIQAHDRFTAAAKLTSQKLRALLFAYHRAMPRGRRLRQYAKLRALRG